MSLYTSTNAPIFGCFFPSQIDPTDTFFILYPQRETNRLSNRLTSTPYGGIYIQIVPWLIFQPGLFFISCTSFQKNQKMEQEIKIIDGYPYIKYEHVHYSHDKMIDKSRRFYEWMESRRSVRDFSDKPVPKEVIQNIIRSASTAPSGAHKQPWTFCVVSDPDIKKQIRKAAEKEEFEGYNGRMSETWINDLKPLGTDWHKPFLETAPYLIIVFKKAFDIKGSGEKGNNYYVNESVGIASGFLLAAIHDAGLVTLTHTPSPMNFLTKILNRPSNERPFLLLPVGYEAEEVYVPNNRRKDLEEVSVFYE